MKLLSSHFCKLSQKLHQPYTITKDQVRLYYQNLYAKLLDSFNNNDFYRIDKLLDISSYKLVIPRMKLPLKDNESNNTLAINFAQLLFKIITIYPVKNYKAQCTAVNYLLVFLKTNNQISGLTFEWLPFYRVMKYFIKTKPFFPSIKEESTSINFKNLAFLLSDYFPDEIETQIDGVTVKTSTTEQLHKKFVTKKNLSQFNLFLPYSKGKYNIFFPYIVHCLQENSNDLICLPIIFRTICCNIEDNFSFLLPLVKKLISVLILNSGRKGSLFLVTIICALFISPLTRLQILDFFDKTLPALRSLAHSSSQESSQFIQNFAMRIVKVTFNYLEKLNKDDPNKKIFNMKKELGPSQEEIHRLFTMMSEINILGIHHISSGTPIQILLKVDPLLMDRYFEIALGCINSTDSVDIASGGWVILNALISSIEKSETLLNNFDSIFRFAINNFHDFGLQFHILNFLLSVFLKVPFNSEKTIQALKHVNFAELANLYYSKLFEILRSLPHTREGEAQLSQSLDDHINLSSVFLLKYCDDSVKNELLPLFTSLANDENISGCYKPVELILANYTCSSSREQAQKIIKAFKRQIDLEHHDVNMFRYLLNVYSTIVISNENTVESIKETIDVLLKFTNNEDEKVRKIAWCAIYNSLTFFDRKYSTDISFKKDVVKDNIFQLVKLEDFEIKDDPIIDLTNLKYEVFDPFYDKLLTSKDPKEVTALLNDIGPYMFFTLNTFNEYPEGSTDDINEIYRGSINVSPDLVKKSIPCIEKYIKCAIRLVKDFPDNENIITNIINNSLLIGYNSSSLTCIIEYHFASYDFSKAHYNLPYLVHIMYCAKNQRKSFLIPPLTDDMKELISLVADLAVCDNMNIQTSCISLLKNAIVYYSSYVNQVIEKIINKDHSNHYKDFIFFLTNVCNEDCIMYNDKLLCKIIIFLLDNFNSNDENSLKCVNQFFFITCLQIDPSGTNKSNKQEYIDLLKELEDKYLFKYPASKTYNQLMVEIIMMCLKQVDEISDKVLEYIIKTLTHYNEQVSFFAQVCFILIMERRSKFTKEKVMIDKYPTVADFPNIFDQVSVQFPHIGLYFPHSLNVVDESEEDNQSETTFNDGEYSIESATPNSLDVNITDCTINEEVKKVFSTFEKIKIHWDYD